ncbi:hypothetical protein NGF19_12700 [Streptomyces sp. RY43-2]|uniref:Cupin domain-containing protein n=1 Tax=Streptomyces macrolidinus TaxID=2952607 RepID=A0ABT0ZDK0_9ACTN|nr:hypothetical protein [Streptomyces macrolidinus]MCN9241642.1 hypothetical protein [Streptomyces macrolidinus]
MGTHSAAALSLVNKVVAEAFDRWSPQLHQEFDRNAHHDQCGQTLLHDTPELRIWQTHLAPGERLPVHRHERDYYWIALTPGQARQHESDGTSREITYERGTTRYFEFSEGQSRLHDVKNIGEDVLSFLIIETQGQGNGTD